MQATLKIDNSRLNDTGDNLLFVRKMRDGATTENRFDQRYTLLDTDFPWRVPVLFEAIGAMDHPCESIKVSVAKHVDRQSYTIIPGQSGSSVFRFRQVRNFVLDSVRMNGQLVQLDNGKSVSAVTFTGGDEITATYLSTIFKCTKEEILDFPYLNEHNEVSFRIYAVPGTEAACGRILEYFIFCRDNQIISKGSGLPQLNYSSIPQSAPGVMIIKLGASEIVRSPEGALVVSAPDIKTLIYNIEALQRILDERFEYQFGFRSVMGLYQSMIRHFNIAGEVLPLNRYFEAEQ
jgi:hypothetical protein